GVMRDFLARFGSAVPLPHWLPTPGNFRLKRNIRRLDGILHDMIQKRRTSEASGAARPLEAAGSLSGDSPREDFLSLLIRARDEGDGSGLSDKQLRDEVITMF